jgi:hypothetical protein
MARITLKPVKRDICYGNSSVGFRMAVCERRDAACGTAVRQRDLTWPTCECRVGYLNTTVKKSENEGKAEG